MTEVHNMDALKERILENIAREEQAGKKETKAKEEKLQANLDLGRDFRQVKSDLSRQSASFRGYMADLGKPVEYAYKRIALVEVTERCVSGGREAPSSLSSLDSVIRAMGSYTDYETLYNAWLRVLDEPERSGRGIQHILTGRPKGNHSSIVPTTHPEPGVDPYGDMTPEERQAEFEAWQKQAEERMAAHKRQHEESGGAKADEMWQKAGDTAPTVGSTLTPEDLREINEKYREKPEEAYAFDIGSWARRLDRIKPEEVAAFLVQESRGTADIALSDADTIIEWHQAFRHAVYRKLNEGLKVVSLREEQQS